jgi:SNF2 family DNA or RNA helicase
MFPSRLGLCSCLSTACLHPILLKDKMVVDVADIGVDEPIDLTNEDDEDDDDLANLLGGLAVDENATKATNDNLNDQEDKPNASAKIRQLLQLLEEIRERGERTIVFSQFTSFLDLLGPFLEAKGISFVRCKSFPKPLGISDKQMMAP